MRMIQDILLQHTYLGVSGFLSITVSRMGLGSELGEGGISRFLYLSCMGARFAILHRLRSYTGTYFSNRESIDWEIHVNNDTYD
jgi:hypothetical protein